MGLELARAAEVELAHTALVAARPPAEIRGAAPGVLEGKKGGMAEGETKPQKGKKETSGKLVEMHKYGHIKQTLGVYDTGAENVLKSRVYRGRKVL